MARVFQLQTDPQRRYRPAIEMPVPPDLDLPCLTEMTRHEAQNVRHLANLAAFRCEGRLRGATPDEFNDLEACRRQYEGIAETIASALDATHDALLFVGLSSADMLAAARLLATEISRADAGQPNALTIDVRDATNAGRRLATHALRQRKSIPKARPSLIPEAIA